MKSTGCEINGKLPSENIGNLAEETLGPESWNEVGELSHQIMEDVSAISAVFVIDRPGRKCPMR